MNRFDPNFNDTDPITRRPFSGGHPDGVWMIAILLGIPVFAAAVAVLVAAAMLIMGKFIPAIGILLMAAVAAILYLPPIVMLFRRRQQALYWMLGLLTLDVITFVIGWSMPEENPLRTQLQIAGIVGILLRGAFAWYLFGLKRQELLR